MRGSHERSHGEVDRTLGMVRKSRKELPSCWDYRVCLPAYAGYLARNDDVLTVAEHSPEGVTG